jgi:hypothetical protein
MDYYICDLIYYKRMMRLDKRPYHDIFDSLNSDYWILILPFSPH